MNQLAQPEAYARAALDRECADLARTGAGRNERLNQAAFSMGQFVGAGCLDRGEVEQRLVEASNSNGYAKKDGDRAVRATIRSGLDSGMREPRSDIVVNGRANGHAAAPALGSPFPSWTPPNTKGKPAFVAIGAATLEARADEVRRHIYRRDGVPVRIKLKRADGGWSNAYRVTRPSDGAVGWQFGQPAGYAATPYFGPAGAIDPFDPELRSETLHWPEGERDVDSLVAAGVLAFTFGGSTDVPPEAAALVADRDVVILADNDAPGRKCADRKAALARDAGAARVRVVHFRELDEGQDVSDWLAKSVGTVDDLAARAEDLTTQAASVEAGPYLARPRLSSSSIRRWIGTEPPETRFVVDRIVPRGMVTLLAGDGGAGKTLLAQLMLTACAAGRSFLGLSVESGAAAGLFGEDPDTILHSRQLRICRELGVSLEEIEPRLRVDSFLGSDTALWRRGAPTAFFAELEEDLRQITDLALVVIDSTSLVFAGDENRRDEVAAFMALLNGLASRLNAAIVLLAHTSKSQADSAASMASGSTAWVWQARSALRLKVGSHDRPELHHPKANHAKKIEPLALRWSEAGVLILDPDLNIAASEAGVRLGHRPRQALNALRDVLLDFGEPAPAALQLPYGLRVVQYERWRAKLQRVLVEPGEDPQKPHVRKALSRVVDELAGKGVIGRDNPYVWIAREPSA